MFLIKNFIAAFLCNLQSVYQILSFWHHFSTYGLLTTPNTISVGLVLMQSDFIDICDMNTRMNRQQLPLLDPTFCKGKYARLELRGIGVDQHAAYVSEVFQKTGAEVLYGGYLEKRNLYSAFHHFEHTKKPVRNIHLGVDFWAPAGTTVFCPLSGKVHSFANRNYPGDYGPIILMEHRLNSSSVYSLYGHLNTDSLTGLIPGKEFEAGQPLGKLGADHENGGYYPHLHFQIIRNLGIWRGDYPGVASEAELDFYSENCPDPLQFLGYE